MSSISVGLISSLRLSGAPMTQSDIWGWVYMRVCSCASVCVCVCLDYPARDLCNVFYTKDGDVFVREHVQICMPMHGHYLCHS